MSPPRKSTRGSISFAAEDFWLVKKLAELDKASLSQTVTRLIKDAARARGIEAIDKQEALRRLNGKKSRPIHSDKIISQYFTF